MKKIRILFTIPNFDTAGSGIVLYKMLQTIDLSSFEPHVLCKHNKGSLFPKVEALGFPMHVFNYTASMDNKLKGVMGAYQISKQLKKINPDIIYSLNYNDDYSEPLAARLAGIKYIYSKKNMNWGGKGWHIRTMLSHGVIVQNSDMKELFFKGSAKAYFIPFGVDETEFTPGEKSKELLQELHIQPHQKLILTVGHIVPVKGFELLVEAFCQLANQYPNVVLMIVGDHENEHGVVVKNQIKASGFSDRIILTGKRSDIKELHRLADIYIQPSYKEGSPISTMEAMACHKLVLATDIPGIRDQLCDNQNQLFAKGDVKDIQDKLEYWLSAPEDEIKKAIEVQYQKITSMFNVKISTQEHEKYFKRMLGK